MHGVHATPGRITELGGLPRALKLLGSATALPVAPLVAARIWAFADGDATVASNIARSLTAVQLRGGAALPDPLPIGGDVHDGELAALSAAERRLLLIAASSLTGSIADILDAAAVESDVLFFGQPRDALAVANGRTAFISPRMRALIIAGASMIERRSAHEALARVAQTRDDRTAAIWHYAHAGRLTGDRPIRSALAAASDFLSRGEPGRARELAHMTLDCASGDLAASASALAGLAEFWEGVFEDAEASLETASAWIRRFGTALFRVSSEEIDAALFARRKLTVGPDDKIYTREEAAQIFEAMGTAARTPADRAAVSQLAAIADAVYHSPHEADRLQAKLFLSHGRFVSSAGTGLSPHAEAHVVMMQVAFQSQSGDHAGAATILRDSIAHLPLAHPAAGVVSSYVRILEPFDAGLDETLANAYDAIRANAPLSYDGDGATIGHGPDVGRRASVAAALQSPATRSAPAPALQNSVSLSPRQREVLRLIVQGHRNKEIADLLQISHRTVEVHVAQLLRKHEVQSRAALIALVSGLGVNRSRASEA